MMAATDRQLDALRTIHALTSKHGYPPTLRELGLAMGIRSTNAVNLHIVALRKKKLIHSTPRGRSRGTTITEAGFRELGVANPDDVLQVVTRLLDRSMRLIETMREYLDRPDASAKDARALLQEAAAALDLETRG